MHYNNVANGAENVIRKVGGGFLNVESPGKKFKPDNNIKKER